jgi:hypothetical protein
VSPRRVVDPRNVAERFVVSIVPAERERRIDMTQQGDVKPIGVRVNALIER